MFHTIDKAMKNQDKFIILRGTLILYLSFKYGRWVSFIAFTSSPPGFMSHSEPVVDKGIRQKSIHSFHSIHSFPDGSAFCPGAPKRVPSDSEKHRRVYTSSNVCHSHEWRVDTASGLALKKQNACLHAVRHAVEKKICVYTRPPK